MPLSEFDRVTLVAIAERAVTWLSVLKVPAHDRESVMSNALYEALRSRTYDPARGPIEAWFRTIVERQVAQYFKRRERVKEREAQEFEDEFAVVDPGMDSMYELELRSQIAAAAIKAFYSSSGAIKEAVSALAHVHDAEKVAEQLEITPEALKTRFSRFASEFKRWLGWEGVDTRVDVLMVINITQVESMKMKIGDVFVTGDVRDGVVGSNNTVKSQVDIHFKDVAFDINRVADIVEDDPEIPASVKVDVLSRLKAIESEAVSDVPRWDVIKGAIAAMVRISPRVIEIAKSLGIGYFS